MSDVDTNEMAAWSHRHKRRVCYLPKTHLFYYSDPKEPMLYPHKYAALAVLQPDDAVIGKREFRKLLEKHTHKLSDSTSYVDPTGIWQELFNSREEPFNDRS